MAVHGLAHPEAELATARGAAAAGVPFILSTTSSPLDRGGRRRRARTRAAGSSSTSSPTRRGPGGSCERAAAAGYGAIVLTVDLPVLGYRDRDRRSGFALPPLGNFREVRATHGSHAEGEPELQNATTLTWADLAEIRGWSGLPLVLKGILTAEDAAPGGGARRGRASSCRNHGGRQLDRVAGRRSTRSTRSSPRSDGRTEVWVDGGVRRGLDVAIALALGARGVLVGRPVYWALAIAGEAGVARALAILRDEFETALALLGTRTPADVGPEHLIEQGATPS